jgi:hypothetical protein
MITPNSKVTALEILQECGVENAASVFGTMRVRIGGISGINSADHLINVPESAESVEVIVGSKVFDLKLNKGNKENNAEIRTISEDAQIVLEQKGIEATQKAERLQKVKQLARMLRENEGDYKPSKDEEEFYAEAIELNESHDEALALAEEAKAQREVEVVKSK